MSTIGIGIGIGYNYTTPIGIGIGKSYLALIGNGIGKNSTIGLSLVTVKFHSMLALGFPDKEQNFMKINVTNKPKHYSKSSLQYYCSIPG